MRNVLITGAAGFIGANFTHYWLQQYPDDRVVALDALTYAGNTWNLRDIWKKSNFTFVQGDITDQALVEKLLTQHQISVIIHFAAESHVDRSITGPDAFINTNIIGTHNLLKAAKRCWLDQDEAIAHHFHHVSTDEVYGTLGPEDPAFTESTPYAPNSPYAASKAASDHLVRAYHHTYGLKVTTSNCSNNYGPYHFPEKLIPLCLLNILHGKDLPIYGDGQQIRDWLYVDDHSRGIDLVIHKGKPGDTYNIGGNNEWANIDTVKLLCQLVDGFFATDEELRTRFPQCPASKGGASTKLISYVTDRPGHDTRYAINAQKIMSELGYQPRAGFADGLTRTVQWYLDNQSWWDKIQDGTYKNGFEQD